MRGKLLAFLCLVIVLVSVTGWIGCSDDAPVATDVPRTATVGPPTESVPGLFLGPIAGVTTAWHPAPIAFVLPRDLKTVAFKCSASPDNIVTWYGAKESARDPSASYAVATVPATGVHARVEVTVVRQPAGGEGKKKPAENALTTLSCGFTVSDVPASDIRVNRIDVKTGDAVGEDIGTSERMQLLLDDGSVAHVTRISAEHYRTAVGTVVHAGAVPSREEFAALMEWRVNGVAKLLGSNGDIILPLKPGAATLSVGPPASARVVTIDGFETAITVEGGRIIPGRPTTFRAKTNPPGFENEVVWMSATLWGDASPAFGTGETFRATFHQPWPTTADGIVCMGVRADNASFVVEQPMGSLEDDMTRLRDGLDDTINELGESVCCVYDSLAQAQRYDAINKLVKAKSSVQKALELYSGLPGLIKAAVNLFYSDVAAEMQTQLTEMEAAIAELKAQPDCGPPPNALETAGAVRRCPDCAIGALFITIGTVLAAVGADIAIGAPTPESKGVGVALVVAGGLLLLIGALLVVSNAGCC